MTLNGFFKELRQLIASKNLPVTRTLKGDALVDGLTPVSAYVVHKMRNTEFENQHDAVKYLGLAKSDQEYLINLPYHVLAG